MGIAGNESGKVGTTYVHAREEPVASQGTDMMDPEFLQVPRVATGPF